MIDTWDTVTLWELTIPYDILQIVSYWTNNFWNIIM